MEPHRRVHGLPLPERTGHDQLRQIRFGTGTALRQAVAGHRAHARFRQSADRRADQSNRRIRAGPVMSAVLAITWEPQLRGILITIIAVMTFCGSCYFLLSTNLGARLGFLVAFAALAGWMFLMGATWWSYGKGLLGPDA